MFFKLFQTRVNECLQTRALQNSLVVHSTIIDCKFGFCRVVNVLARSVSPFNTKAVYRCINTKVALFSVN